ncbi:cytochrome P450, partial [Blastocladiella britannica]
DTTGTTLAWITAHLANNPEIQHRAHAEIDAHLRNTGATVPTLADMPHLPLVRAIIKEALRIDPVVPLGVPHMTSAETQVGGYRIPRGTQVMFQLKHLHDESRSDGREFKPDRATRAASLDVPDGLFTFGHGRRMCPGVHLAYRELFVATARVLAEFEVVAPLSGKINVEPRFGLTSVPKDGVHVKFVPRTAARPQQ